MQEGTYNQLAGEYYEDAHKTSRNFDLATKAAFAGSEIPVPEDGLILEPGCGRGRAGEFLGVSPARVVQLDANEAMLRLPDREDCLVQVLDRAERLPFPAGQFACVSAFLCDPFLGLRFLAEAKRVLRPGGLLVGTTPSFEWGAPLRKKLGLDLMVTRFKLNSGEVMTMPSALYPAPQLRQMLERAEFDPASIQVRPVRLPGEVPIVSPDIEIAAQEAGTSAQEIEILYLFTATA